MLELRVKFYSRILRNDLTPHTTRTHSEHITVHDFGQVLGCDVPGTKGSPILVSPSRHDAFLPAHLIPNLNQLLGHVKTIAVLVSGYLFFGRSGFSMTHHPHTQATPIPSQFNPLQPTPTPPRRPDDVPTKQQVLGIMMAICGLAAYNHAERSGGGERKAQTEESKTEAEQGVRLLQVSAR